MSPKTSHRAPQTLFEKIWQQHAIFMREDGQTLLYVDRHFLQDGSAPAFELLRQRGLEPRAPHRAFATPDHYVPTHSRDLASLADPEKRAMAEALRNDTEAAGIPFFGLDDARQGIVHVVAPEQGLSQPGMLIVCGDSHTSTHGALGALAFGIGTTEVAHVLATQTLWQRKPKTLRVLLQGRCVPASRRRTSFSRSSPRSARRAPQATSSSTRARRSPRCRWKRGSRSAT